MLSNIESIKFSNVSYSRNRKQILSNVYGEFRPNRLTAILGASGSGKTTLLKIISGRLRCNNRKIMMGHYNLSQKALLQISAFMQQEDVLPQHDTVEEAINFSRMLRNKEYQMDDLDDLGLRHVFDSKISKLSSGEKKRLGVALELVSTPHFLYLDEPISGADCKMASSIVKHLKKLCENRTVVMAVHQPSSEIFFEFDDILVLKEGQTVYYGPSNEIFQMFKSYDLQCPNYSNPADFLFIHVLPLCVLEQRAEEEEESLNFETNVFFKKDNVSVLKQFKLIYARDLRKKARNKMKGVFTLASTVFTALMIGILFYGLRGITDQEIKDKNIIGLLNFCSMSFIFTSSLGILNSLYEDYKLFLKEYQSGYYSMVPYFFGVILNDTMLNVLFPLISCFIIYFLAKLDYSSMQIIRFMANTVLTTLIGQNIGILSSVLLPSVSVALLILPLVLLFFAVLNGVFVDNLIGVFRFLQCLSPFRYSFNVLAKNHQEDTTSSGIFKLWVDDLFFTADASLCIEFVMIVALFVISLLFFWVKMKMSVRG